MYLYLLVLILTFIKAFRSLEHNGYKVYSTESTDSAILYINTFGNTRASLFAMQWPQFIHCNRKIMPRYLYGEAHNEMLHKR